MKDDIRMYWWKRSSTTNRGPQYERMVGAADLLLRPRPCLPGAALTVLGETEAEAQAYGFGGSASLVS
jgi:hypothetical protein